MKIQVSQKTYEKLAPYYEFEPRGEIEIKVCTHIYFFCNFPIGQRRNAGLFTYRS